MTLDAKALYRELILEHGKRPRNAGSLADATHRATAHNPLCGDRVTIHLRVASEALSEARFEARGCVIACASASLLTEIVAGRTLAEALSWAAMIQALVNENPPPENVGPLEALRGVREFPARKACALLAWDALGRALAPQPTPPK